MKSERIKTIIISIFLTASYVGILFITPSSEAHILIIGDSSNDYDLSYTEAQQLAKTLKSRGYPVLELYRNEATAKNILKGMYNADAIIYAGHGGYQSGNYNNVGGTAKPPFALVGSDNFIWGIGDKMREAQNGETFYAPFKPNIPVILLHSCFSTGWVGNNEVANPIETIYNFSKMFTGSGANYYATSWNGAEIIYDFLNGATNFANANQKNYEIIKKSTSYNDVLIWRNDHGHAAFVGDWSGTFPSASQTTPYDDQAAEIWYNSARNEVVNPLSVVSTNPVKGATGVSLTTLVTITFSENILAGNNYAGIYIKNLNTGNKVTIASKTISGNTLTIKQTYNRIKNNNYQVYLPTGAVKDQTGNTITTYTYQFNTGTSTTTDKTPPTITNTNPASGATGVSLNTPVTITFSENILAGNNYAGIYIKNLNTGNKVTIASKTISGNTLTIKQTYNRIKNNNYQVYLPAGAVKDQTGNTITTYTYQFNTIS